MDTASYPVAPLDPYAERITSGIAMLGGVLMLPTLFLYLSGFLLTGVGVTGAVITAAVALALAVWLVLNYAVQPASYEIQADRVQYASDMMELSMDELYALGYQMHIEPTTDGDYRFHRKFFR